MSKYFKTAFEYKLSFDPGKREKNQMKVHYSIPMDDADCIGKTIPEGLSTKSSRWGRR